MQICEEFPTEYGAEAEEEIKHIIEKTGLGLEAVCRGQKQYKKDTDDNADHSGFYKFAACVDQRVLIFLLALFLFILRLLLPIALNLGGSGVAQAGRVLFGALLAQALSALLTGRDSVPFNMVKAFHGGNSLSF